MRIANSVRALSGELAILAQDFADLAAVGCIVSIDPRGLLKRPKFTPLDLRAGLQTQLI
jgi:hypothetical protein